MHYLKFKIFNVLDTASGAPDSFEYVVEGPNTTVIARDPVAANFSSGYEALPGKGENVGVH